MSLIRGVCGLGFVRVTFRGDGEVRDMVRPWDVTFEYIY